MRHLWLCALLALASPSVAQEDSGGGEAQQQQGGDSGGGDEAERGDAPRAVTLEEARQSISTLVESFVGQHSPEGYLALRDKTTKRVRQLKLLGVDEKKTKPAGDARYSVPARFKDLVTGQSLQGIFTADFSQTTWKVVGMRLIQPSASKARAKSSGELKKRGE